MVGRAGEGIGSHGFGCGSDSGSSTSVDSVVDVCLLMILYQNRTIIHVVLCPARFISLVHAPPFEAK